MNDKHIIWSNYNLNFDDFKTELSALYPDKTDDELRSIMYENNNEFLNDERVNLDIQLPREIVIIADIGRWNGRFSGYKEISSGNIKDCLYSECDHTTWYVDKDGDLRCDAIHHDGTNYYLYRTYKPNTTDKQIEDLKNKLYDGTVTKEYIKRVTDCLGDNIAKVYGFNLPKTKQSEHSR